MMTIGAHGLQQNNDYLWSADSRPDLMDHVWVGVRCLKSESVTTGGRLRQSFGSVLNVREGPGVCGR